MFLNTTAWIHRMWFKKQKTKAQFQLVESLSEAPFKIFATFSMYLYGNGFLWCRCSIDTWWLIMTYLLVVLAKPRYKWSSRNTIISIQFLHSLRTSKSITDFQAQSMFCYLHLAPNRKENAQRIIKIQFL